MSEGYVHRHKCTGSEEKNTTDRTVYKKRKLTQVKQYLSGLPKFERVKQQ